MALFKGTIPEAKYLKEPIQAIAKLITEGTFHIDENGMRLVALDPAKVAMVDFTLTPAMFVDFDLKEPVKITLDIDYLSKIVKRAKAKDEIVFEVDDNKSRLYITIKDSFRRRFAVPLIGTTEEEVPIPEQFEFKAKAEVEGGYLRETIKDAKLISDEVIFKASQDKFSIIAKSEAGEIVSELVPGQDPALLNLEVEEESEAKYGIDYLEKIIRAEKVADTITIEFATNYPCRITYKTLDKLKLTFILANRVEE